MTRDARPLLAALFAGEAASSTQFLKDIAPIIWSVCSLLVRDDRERREAFADVAGRLRANNFALLSDYSGRGTLETFVALTVRDLLADRVLILLQSNADKGWRAFQQLFESDLQRLIRRRLPGSDRDDLRQEAYQSICLAFIEEDYRRLRSYGGSGSFTGFVVRTADRLLVDWMRRISSRRRLPGALLKESAFDQEVFKLVFWQGVPERPDLLAPHLHSRIGRTPDNGEIAAALLKVRAYARDGHGTAHPVLTVVTEDLSDGSQSSAEDRLIEAEEDAQLGAAVTVLARAKDSLTERERLYLTIVLGSSEPIPSREIAQLMQRPVEEVYKLKQRVLKRLRELMSDDSAIKDWRESISPSAR